MKEREKRRRSALRRPSRSSALSLSSRTRLSDAVPPSRFAKREASRIVRGDLPAVSRDLSKPISRCPLDAPDARLAHNHRFIKFLLAYIDISRQPQTAFCLPLSSAYRERKRDATLIFHRSAELCLCASLLVFVAAEFHSYFINYFLLVITFSNTLRVRDCATRSLRFPRPTLHSAVFKLTPANEWHKTHYKYSYFLWADQY